MKIPTIVGIFIFISRENLMLSRVKHEKSFITSEPCLELWTQIFEIIKSGMLINHKLLIIANSSLLNTAEHENFSANKYENANYCWHFHIY